MSALYRKRPIVVEAVRFVKPYKNATVFCPDIRFIFEGTNKIAWAIVPTKEGKARADIGDWIIKGIAGEFYPCKSDIFEATYDPVKP